MNRSVVVALSLVVLSAGNSATAGSCSAWSPIGPSPIQGTEFPGGVTGRATAIAVNPANGSQVWVGGAAGGVWFSSNRGLDWHPVSDFEESLAIGAIAVADCGANGCDTIYVGTGENAIRRDTYHGAGLLVGTSEGGDPSSYQWTMIHGDAKTVEFRGASIHDVLYNPNTSGDTRILYVTVSSGVTVSSTNATVTAPEPALGGYGIYRSPDNGATWTKLNVADSNGARPTDLKMDPLQPNVLYADLTRQRMFAGTHGRGAWVRGSPLLFPIEDWVEGLIWDIPIWGWIYPPNEICTIDILQADGTTCASSTTDAMGASVRTDADGRLITSLTTAVDGVFDQRAMAWACFGGTCAGGVPTDECDTPENHIDAVRVSCGTESSTVTLQGAQTRSDPSGAGLGLDFVTNGAGGFDTHEPAISFDVVLTLFGADGSTESLCSVEVIPDTDLPRDQTWDSVADAINMDATCMDAGIIAVNDAGEPPMGPDGGPTDVFEDDFRPPPRLRLNAPLSMGTQLIPSLHVSPGAAQDTCFELADLGLPMLSQGAVTVLRFETLEAGAHGGEIYLLEQTPLGDCGVTVPTDVGMTADEIALAVQMAFQEFGVPGPDPDCPSKYNPRDITANGDRITTAIASRVRLCIRDDGVGVFIGPEDLSNSHPIAACAAQVVECEDPAGTDLQLDGSSSSDPDSTPGTNDDIAVYEWFMDDGSGDLVLLGTGPTLPVSLSLGLHDIRLLVTDRRRREMRRDADRSGHRLAGNAVGRPGAVSAGAVGQRSRQRLRDGERAEAQAAERGGMPLIPARPARPASDQCSS